jgi:uncharacterized protein YecE (DUF72 family)
MLDRTAHRRRLRAVMAQQRPIGDRRGAIRVGLSGWRYPPWRRVFYPKRLPRRRELEYASRRFSTIEINGSFYSLQRPEYYARWHDETPDDFVFSVKGARFITHMLRLRNCDQALANFFASGIANLREKMGPLLWQLPPNFRFDREALERFFRSLPMDAGDASALARRHDEKVADRAACRFTSSRRLRHALEVRNPTFIDEAFVDLLRRYAIALVVADTAGKWPYAEDVTADFVYVRLHGDEELYVSGYGDDALDRWSGRLVGWSEGRTPAGAQLISRSPPPVRTGRDVFCYFDNDVKVMAPRDAHALAVRIRGAGGNIVLPEAMGDADAPTLPVTTGRRSGGARASWPNAGSGSAARKS